MLDITFSLTITFFYCWLFINAARNKYNAIDDYAQIIAHFNIPGVSKHRFWVLIIMSAEISCAFAVALSLIFPTLILMPLALLSLYLWVIGGNLLSKRRHIRCGCSGSASQQTISLIHLWRLIALLLLLPIGLLDSLYRAVNSLDILTILLCSFSMIMLYCSSDILIENRYKLDTLRS